MTSNEEQGASSNPCPVCNVGEVNFNISKFFPASVAIYEQVDKRGKKRHRARLEIRTALVEEFVRMFDNREAVAVFVVPMEKLKREINEKDLEALDNG